MDIPQHHGVVAAHRLLDGVIAFFDIHTPRHTVFVLPGGEFIQNILDGTIPMHQQQLPGRENLPVRQVRHKIPDREKQKLLCRHPDHMMSPQHEPAVHQAELAVGNHVDAQQGEKLGKKNIQRLQIADFQCAVGVGKKEQQGEIQTDDQTVAVGVEPVGGLIGDMLIVISKPVVGIESGQDTQPQQRQRQYEQPFLGIVLSHASVPLVSLGKIRYLLSRRLSYSRRSVANSAQRQKCHALAKTERPSCFRYRSQIRVSAVNLLEDRDFFGLL